MDEGPSLKRTTDGESSVGRGTKKRARGSWTIAAGTRSSGRRESATHISRLEGGGSENPRLHTLTRVSEELGLTMEELLAAYGHGRSGVPVKDQAAMSQLLHKLRAVQGSLLKIQGHIGETITSLEKQLPNRAKPVRRARRR